MNRHETRAAPIVGVKGDGRTLEARAVAYGIVDDYRTRFVRGVFNDGLSKRLPVLAWSHDWADPIGRVTDWDDRTDGLYITARLSDPDAVPRARQAMSQLADGTLSDVSVGFMRQKSMEADDGITDITKGELDEVSLVLRGAVPGSEVLAVRRRQPSASDRVSQVVGMLRAQRLQPVTSTTTNRDLDRMADLTLELIRSSTSSIRRHEIGYELDELDRRLGR